MCGICGIISKQEANSNGLDGVKRMNTELIHRGPDSEGYFSATDIVMGMRRLSIIDLDNGSQPLYSEDKTITLIANGEIYNYIELRQELILRGHSFHTKSDCETIIHAYEEYGDDFVNHLRGMFAFCLHDKKANKVLLVRDRIGEKPLYIYETEKKIIFSSELKSLLKSIPTNERGLNHSALQFYFLHGYFPLTETPLLHARKLRPGHMLIIDTKADTHQEINYWDMLGAPAIETDPTLAIQNQFNEIEKIIIRSDVPVGISLSGGIDSSMVATLAARYTKTKMHAFSVGYPGYPENDERKHAKKLADTLGLTFHDIEITGKDFTNDIGNLVTAMDEPIADIAAYGYYAVSRAAHKERVPVLLAGFGGDELFWGYAWTRKVAHYNDLKKTFIGKMTVFTKLNLEYFRQIPRKPFTLISLFARLSFSDILISNELTPQWIYIYKNKRDIFTASFLKKQTQVLGENGDVDTNNGLKVTETLAKTWLVSNCIDLGDRMSMAHSVELRLPLLDYRLFETVVGIRKKYPQDYTLGYKHWLIQATKDILPKEIFDRRKRGFTPPVQSWVNQAVQEHAMLLSGGYSVKNGIINLSYIEKALTNPSKHSKFLYTLLVFELWAKTYLS